MKHLRKIMSVLLTAIMVLAMCVPVMAENVNLSNHTFAAYQIFKGDFTSKKLTNIDWGEGVDSAALLADLQTKEEYVNCNTVTKVAEKLSELANNTDKVQEFADIVKSHLIDGKKITGTGTIELPAAGYYFIEDTTNVDGQDDAKNFSLLKVNAAGTVTPQVKTDKPILEKKVKDINDSTSNSTTGWQDSADYDIGDSIPYMLTATMGDLTYYETYSIKFIDTMTHLTLNEFAPFVVQVGDRTLNTGEYTKTWNSVTKTLEVAITDVKALGAANGTKVTVEYEATLDSDATIGSTGNPNEAKLQYSNNPNENGTGETAPDKNIVFTYKVVANKVDADGKKLAGAAFELFKKNANGQFESVGIRNATKDENGNYTLSDNAKTTFEWNGLDDGDYRIEEVVTPEGYNTIAPIEFQVTADHEIESNNPRLTRLVGGNGFTGEASTGVISSSIVNKQGSTLPETGGIGTTIFYVVGVVLMLGAGVLLITKRRMSAKH